MPRLSGDDGRHGQSCQEGLRKGRSKTRKIALKRARLSIAKTCLSHEPSLHKGFALGRSAVAGMPRALTYREATFADLLTVRAQVIPRARTFPQLM